MGEIISLDRLKRGEFARRDGLSQILAMRAIYNTLSSLKSSDFAIAFQGYGSAPNGKAGRRGDADMLVGWARIKNGLFVRSRSNEEVIKQDLFEQSIERMIHDISARFHVHAEARIVSLVDTQEGTSELLDEDPLFLDHIARAPLEWRIGDPLQGLRKRAINIEEPLTRPQEIQIVATGFAYMTLKGNGFASALQWLEDIENGNFDFKAWQEDFDPKRLVESTEDLQLETFQRALEFAKAAARKIVAIGVVEGMHVENTDVTSRADMYRRFQAMSGIIDGSGKMKKEHSRLTQLDVTYDELLERTIAEKSYETYDDWIKKHLIIALKIAYHLAAHCHRYIERVIDEKKMVVAEFPDFYDDSYRLSTLDDVGVGSPITSSSAPLSVGHLR